MYSIETLKFKVPAAILAGSLGAVGLSACDAELNKDEPATVLEHHHHGAWIQPVRVGKTTTFITHPERFELKLEQCGRDGEEGADENGCITDSVDVSKSTYKHFEDGETIVLSTDD